MNTMLVIECDEIYIQCDQIWQNFKSLWHTFYSSFGIIANPFWHFFGYWANVHCFKWPNIKQIIYPSGHTEISLNKSVLCFQYTGKILAAFVFGLTDRNPAIRKMYAMSIGHLLKTAKDSSVEKLFLKMKSWFIEKDDDATRMAVALTFQVSLLRINNTWSKVTFNWTSWHLFGFIFAMMCNFIVNTFGVEEMMVFIMLVFNQSFANLEYLRLMQLLTVPSYNNFTNKRLVNIVLFFEIF